MGSKAETKYIPDIYKYGSVDTRIALLQGLCDTDGYATACGYVKYATASKQLAEDIREVVLSLGGTSTIVVKQTTHLPSHSMSLSLPSGITPFRLSRKLNRFLQRRYTTKPHKIIQSIEYVGHKQAQCITVNNDDGLYLTRDFTVTHNSLNFAVIFGAAAQRLKDYMLDTFGLVLSLSDCTKLRTKYLAGYPDLVRYHVDQRERVKREGRISVLGGRAVLLQPGADLYTHSLNFPAVLAEQSGIKRAMGDLCRWLIQQEEDAWLSFYMYDELHVNSPDSAADRLGLVLDKFMQEDMQMYCEHPDVRITSEAKAVDSWDQK